MVSCTDPYLKQSHITRRSVLHINRVQGSLPSPTHWASYLYLKQIANETVSFESHHRNIKNAVIGNKAKKSSFIRLNVIPKIIELLVQDDTRIEFVVESVVLLGSLARGMLKMILFYLMSFSYV